MESVTRIQLKKMSKIFRRTGKTFQKVAQEAGLNYIPDHANELTKNQARQILKHFGFCFAISKTKQG